MSARQPITKTYTYWAPKGRAEFASAPYPSLSFWPHGLYSGAEMQVSFQREMPHDQRVAIAERVLATVQAWRDQIVADAESARTAEDELADAKRRIAELERRVAAEECRCPEPAPLCDGCDCRCHADAEGGDR